ncbi:hypothetical protein ABEH50_004030 [Yersinia enterocolitica]
MTTEELDRQDFEAWFVPRFHPRHMHRNKMGNYYFMDADIAWTVWQARSAELLSLREQLAELKALEPVGYVGNSDLYALSTGTLGCIAPYNAFEGIPLFTAAKPAED